jgi:hypothetical protein
MSEWMLVGTLACLLKKISIVLTCRLVSLFGRKHEQHAVDTPKDS